jgi:hypothetical protein
MRVFMTATLMMACLALCGCEGDYEGKPGEPAVEIKGTPDLDPRTDHDIDVKPPDIDVDVQSRPGQLPKVEVDALKTPDTDTKANQP